MRRAALLVLVAALAASAEDAKPKTCFAWAADGKTWATGEDHAIRIFDAETGKEKTKIDGPKKAVRSVAFASDGRLYSTGDDGAVHSWDLATGKHVRAFGDAVKIAAFAVSPDAKTVIVATSSTLTAYDAENGKKRFSIKAGDAGWAGVAFSTDGKRFATAGASGFEVKEWSAATGEVVAKRESSIGNTHSIALVVYTPVGLISAGKDGLRYWLKESAGGGWVHDDNKEAAITGLAVSPDHKVLAASASDGSIRLFAIANGLREDEKSAWRPGEKEKLVSPAFSADGKTLGAIRSPAGEAVFYDISTAKEIKK